MRTLRARMARKRNRRAGRNPKNLSLDPRVIALGQKLAEQDRREFSGQVSWLIEEEIKRRNLTAPTAA